MLRKKICFKSVQNKKKREESAYQLHNKENQIVIAKTDPLSYNKKKYAFYQKIVRSRTKGAGSKLEIGKNTLGE